MATNSFGLDAAYFSDKLSLVLRDLGHFTPEELARTLARMARTACEGVLGEAEFAVQAAPTCAAQDGDAQLDAMRRSGLSIDGDNAYKRDLIDCIVGALMLGKQGVNPPPAGHWLEQFWQMARGEGEIQEQLAATPAAPVAQEPVAWPDEIHQMAFEEGQPAENGDGYSFIAEEFDLFVERLLTQAAPPAAEQPNHSAAADMVWCACGDGYPALSYGAGFISGSGMCENCDAALPAKDMAAEPDTVKAPRELLAEAESIIESYAESLKASHAPGGDWEGEEAAHDEYELEAGVASKLRALLGKEDEA